MNYKEVVFSAQGHPSSLASLNLQHQHKCNPPGNQHLGLKQGMSVYSQWEAIEIVGPHPHIVSVEKTESSNEAVSPKPCFLLCTVVIRIPII